MAKQQSTAAADVATLQPSQARDVPTLKRDIAANLRMLTAQRTLSMQTQQQKLTARNSNLYDAPVSSTW